MTAMACLRTNENSMQMLNARSLKVKHDAGNSCFIEHNGGQRASFRLDPNALVRSSTVEVQEAGNDASITSNLGLLRRFLFGATIAEQVVA